MNRKLSRSVWGEGVGKVLVTVTRWPPTPLYVCVKLGPGATAPLYIIVLASNSLSGPWTAIGVPLNVTAPYTGSCIRLLLGSTGGAYRYYAIGIIGPGDIVICGFEIM